MKKAVIILVAIASLYSLFCLAYVATEKLTAKNSKIVQQKTIQQVPTIPLDANKLLELVNAERAKVGVAPLISDPQLVQSAQSQANDMVTNNYFGHINPTTGKHGYEYIPSGYCSQAGENVGANIDTVGDQNAIRLKSWLDSKPHHDALLDPKFTLTGIAIKEQTPSHFVAVQHFCQAK
jgi:uncharacterized protein YkwD